MSVTGIVAEFNPFHKGHRLLIDRIHTDGSSVVCAISGNFVQRGDTAVIPKQKRARAALRCGADLVVELPVCWSMSTAQNFALGGVSQLMAMGCDRIAFGSESGDLCALEKTADVLSNPALREQLNELLSTGITFAKARESAAQMLGVPNGILSNPNDTLAVEYILAARKLGFSGTFFAVKREGAGHDSNAEHPDYVSSSFLRSHLLSGNIGYAERFMPEVLQGVISPDDVSDIKRLETAILSALRVMNKDDFALLPDISEGLENKLYFASQLANSLDELYAAVKSKRYSLARVRRLVLSAYLKIPSETFGKQPPYVRILGLNGQGENILKSANPQIPVYGRASELKNVSGFSKTVFETECRATDLYSLSFKKPQPCGLEYKTKLLKAE